MEIRITQSRVESQDHKPFESVERKGIGHPDTICDAISEALSRRYARYCQDRFGRVAHHWFDKVMLIGGEADIGYGGGRIVKRAKIICAGKCAFAVGSEPIPVEAIARAAVEEVLAQTLIGFAGSAHYDLSLEIVDSQGAGRRTSRYRPASSGDLVDLDASINGVSNDSNLLVGFAPFSRLEKLVLTVERHVNGREFKARHPDTGTDVKVFGQRHGEEFGLLVNVPFLAAKIQSLEHYFRRKNDIVGDIRAFCADTLGLEPELMVNATDRNGDPYLTALGSVADTGDVGVTGRGNRITGLITPMRPMSIEAPAGKNPIDHTGKLYAVTAQRAAEAINVQTGLPVELHIFTAKETPLGTPDRVDVALNGDAYSKSGIVETVRNQLDSLKDLRKEFLYSPVEMW